jgi:hypothetical protein
VEGLGIGVCCSTSVINSYAKNVTIKQSDFLPREET